LGSKDFVVNVLRELVGRDAPLLILADELRKFGPDSAAGEESPLAVSALKALASISQTSFAMALENGDSRVVYVSASALSAYDAIEAVSKGSNRPVYWLPLPPLSLKGRDDSLKREFDAAAAAVGLNKVEKEERWLAITAGLTV